VAVARHNDLLRLATVGVYGFSLDRFLLALQEADVAVLLDVRQRRGVRGSEYAWANSLRLQGAVKESGIAYEHHPELAPTTELRHLQYREDAKLGVGKRSRELLAPQYRERYVTEILDKVDLEALAKSLPRDRACALMCVERDPKACHRWLIAQRLAERNRIKVVHLLPC
jgi:uncharacterized protein (DUF488 family)